MRTGQEPRQHYSVNFEPNERGWIHAECQCGWVFGLCPNAEDAADALMEHAYEQAVLENRDVAYDDGYQAGLDDERL